MKRNMQSIIFVSFLIFALVLAKIDDNEIHKSCKISKELKQEIDSYSAIATKIMKAVVDGVFQNSTYYHLADFVDKFGSRFTGTWNLESAIDYIFHKSTMYNFDDVRTEPVKVPTWVRGNEYATLIEPRKYNLRMLGLGYSVGTPKEGITAEAIVIKDFDELKQNAHLVKDKIVVYDEKYISYPESVKYRSKGASRASIYGAVAALVSSVTPFSLNTPHTGMQTYEPSVEKIPVACITVEDAHMLRRIQNRGETIVITLKMDARMLEPKISRNTIVDIKGTTYPEKYVVVSGHIDSWDVGQGAMDDGGGAFISWNSLVILKKLNLIPRRTMRAILWTGEEMGTIGAQQYIQNHKNELKNFTFVMESDIGTFTPTGLAVSGTKEAVCIVQEILNLLSSINATLITEPQEGPDISSFVDLGVPGASLLTKNKKYFYYHHSEADTMDVEDPKALNLCTAVWAIVSYVIADLSVDIPKILKL